MVFVPKFPKVCGEITLEMYWIFAYISVFPQKPFYKMKYLPTYRIPTNCIESKSL